MRLPHIILSLLMIVGVQGNILSQEVTNLLQTNNMSSALVQHGFQGVTEHTVDSTLIISFENRLYRLEANAIYNILEIINKDLGNQYNKLILISKKQDIPLIACELNLNDFQALKVGEISIQQFKQKLVVSNSSSYFNSINKTSINSGNYKIEIVVEPTLGLALGGFPDPVLHQINLNPILNIFLWKGATVKLQGIFPLSNEIEVPEEKYIRPGILSFNQQIRLPKDIFVNAGIGYFTSNRYGGNLSAKKFFINGNLMLQGSLGYTGNASYPQIIGEDQHLKKWQYSNLNYLDYAVGANYWLAKYNLRIGISYGKFLNEKRAIRAELFQNFKETRIGFFALKTEGGNNYGMQIAVPFFPKKYWKPKIISVRPPTHFRYTYHSKQSYIKDYWTGNNNFEQTMNPSLVKYQLLGLLQKQN